MLEGIDTMPYLATVLLLAAPAALAAHIHCRLRRLPKGVLPAAVYAVYFVILNAILIGFKLVRGASVENFVSWFSPPLSFLFYLAVACALGILLPLLFVLAAEKRVALRYDETRRKPAAETSAPWNAKRVWRTLRRMAAVLAAGILIGAVLVTAVYALPTDNIKKNVRASAETVASEGSYPFVYSNWRSTRLDNFTDSIMLLIASYDGNGSLIQNAMLSTYIRFDELDPAEGLVKWSTGATDGMFTHSYSRYWHGYLVWLKPLLEVFTYPQIRAINTAAQMLLMLWALAVMVVKKQKRLILPFLIMYLFLTPVALFRSFQFSWIFYVTVLSSIALLLRFDRLKRRGSFYVLFLIAGMATSYVDFLTYPLITLGVPMVVYLVLRTNRTWKQGVVDVIALAVAWGVGYVGMWAGKWLLCTLLTDSNILRSVQDNISARMSFHYVEESFGIVDIIKRNIEAYNHWVYMGPFLLCLLVYALLYGKERASLRGGSLTVNAGWLGAQALPLLLVALSPFAWFFVASNHTYIHYWYAHRTLAVSAFAVLAAFAQPPAKPVSPRR